MNYRTKGSLCVCGAFLIQFTLGTMYTFGNMSPYIASYLKFKTNDVWITTGDTVWVLAGTFFTLGGLMAIGGQIEKKIGNRYTCLIGSWLVSFCVAITYFSVQKSIWLVLLTYGLGFGTGIAIAYSVALTSAMKWFPDRRGMISGIVVGGFGLGAFALSFIQTKYINPLNIPPRMYNNSINYTFVNASFLDVSGSLQLSNNMSRATKEKYFYDESILNKVPMCFVIMGVIYAIIQSVGVLMLMDHGSATKSSTLNKSSTNEKEPPNSPDSITPMEELTNHIESKKALLGGPDNLEDDSEKKKMEPKSGSENINFTVKEAVKNKMFWMLWLTFFFNGIVIVTISAVFKSFGQQFISDDQYFATLGAVGGICNCFGRVGWGNLYDKFKYRIVMSALTIMMVVTMGTFYFLSFITNVVLVKTLYFIWGCLLFIALSGSFAVLPNGTAQCFGSLNLSTIYGLVFTGLAGASIVGAFISSFLFNALQYKGQFIIATISAGISLILTQFFRNTKKAGLLDDRDVNA